VQQRRFSETKLLRGNKKLDKRLKPKEGLRENKKLDKSRRSESNNVENGGGGSRRLKTMKVAASRRSNGGMFLESLKEPAWAKLTALTTASCECIILIALTD
jgi:hypothetical protein